VDTDTLHSEGLDLALVHQMKNLTVVVIVVVVVVVVVVIVIVVVAVV